ncbi:MAG: GTPase [Clostridia bacterium]
MPIPHQEMRRIIKRRIRGLEGSARVDVLRQFLDEFPGYYNGPYGELRKWVLALIDEANLRGEVRHRESFFLARQGAAQVVLVGPPNAGKSSLLHALTGRQVAIGDYPFTTLRPVEGMVAVDGAQIQLIDLPGLIGGASDGKGGGKSVLAAIRIADAALHVVPLTEEGLDESRVVAAELDAEGIAVPRGLVATKSDLDPDGSRLQRLHSAFPHDPVAVCSTTTGDGLETVRALVWDLSGLIRVFSKPRGGRISSDPVVLDGGSTVADLVGRLNRAWMGKVRFAMVTGSSARFAGQRVGLDHVLQDGDVVELALD